MELDFSVLNSKTSEATPANQDENKREEYNAGMIQQLDRRKEELETAQRVYAEYQTNIRRAERYTSDIARELKEGKELAFILLKAVKCISLLTGEEVLYSQCLEDLKAVYGWGLGEPASLQIELKEAGERLTRLTRPELAEGEIPNDTQRRIQTAVKAHKELIDRLRKATEGQQ